MIVHSFSPDRLWFDAFARFIALFGVEAKPNQLLLVRPSATFHSMPVGHAAKVVSWRGKRHILTCYRAATISRAALARIASGSVTSFTP